MSRETGTHLYAFSNQHVRGFEKASATNDAADEIIYTPDRFLLSQKQLFEVEGGWANVGVSFALSGLCALTLFGARPAIGRHLAHGQLNFKEWATLGSAMAGGYYIGHHAGVIAFGDYQRYVNHWNAYTFVKAQNRYEGREILGKAPMYY